MESQLNVCPVNFFLPNLVKYPNFERALRYPVNIESGDCIFVPAYFFYQMQGYQKTNQEKALMDMFPHLYNNLTETSIEMAQKEKALYESEDLATAVSLKFMGNSKILAGFYDAVEKKIIN